MIWSPDASRRGYRHMILCPAPDLCRGGFYENEPPSASEAATPSPSPLNKSRKSSNSTAQLSGPSVELGLGGSSPSLGQVFWHARQCQPLIATGIGNPTSIPA